jgi:hypothetical protein
MFKKENCAQKQQIIIGIGKLAEVIKTNLGDQYKLIISQNIKQQKYCFYIILLGKHNV